ncbi:hypothetical protein [Hyphomonas sp.]|jgi:hypothetical protein|uniref:hypothetical protein n=1 Tax=Hyphomonas sp. TaxID=87 RepID=UPI0025BF788B|nr:hypothetical protein [Hyphomonas sp.]MBA4338847.1 hypothetical protein [Hyphomonas sp.]
MTKGTLLRNNRLLGALALAVLVAALTVAHFQGGISMELGEMLLSVQSQHEDGLVVSFVQAP